MLAETTLWSYVSQWFGFVGWCATAGDAACRPFLGFLALAGASGGVSALLVLALVDLLKDMERAYLAARSSAEQARRVRALQEQVANAAISAPVPAAALPQPDAASEAEPEMPGPFAMPAEASPVAAVELAAPVAR
jgi:hypothetical protein